MEYKVNRYYQNMCPEAEGIITASGDRFMMRNEWQYPRELYDHLMSCPECEKRNTVTPQRCLLVPFSAAEVRLLEEALSLLSIHAQVRDEVKVFLTQLMTKLEGKI